MARSIMIQGCGSNVGKSMLVAGLARAFVRRGLSVAPFKPQNMSNNAAVTVDGGEIGRAQALQARAARLEAHTDMNPVLLKPESETGAQVIVQGQRRGHAGARSFMRNRDSLMPPVLESFGRLCAAHDLVLVEGAGSPAETNLRAGDIANMGFAQAAQVPVILTGDIDRGGVIAQIIGTRAVLDNADRALIKGFLINKFRGDPRLFDGGRDDIVARSGWPCLGVLPWFNEAWKLPAEDVLDLASRPGGACRVAVPQLPRIANFDDLDPLVAEANVTVQIVPPGQALPGDADLILLPGSKSTLNDMAFLRAQGWDIDIQAHVRRGGHVLGLCGGYQMLGKRILDPAGADGGLHEIEGLGLLDIETVMQPAKELALKDAQADGHPVYGYEIHLGQTTGPDCDRGWIKTAQGRAGAQSADGRIRGCYLHGILAADGFRAAYLEQLGHSGEAQYEAQVDETLEKLADHMERHADLDQLLTLAEAPRL